VGVFKSEFGTHNQKKPHHVTILHNTVLCLGGLVYLCEARLETTQYTVFFAVIHDIMMFLLPYVKAAFLCGLVAVLFDLEKFGDHHDPSDSYIWYVE